MFVVSRAYEKSTLSRCFCLSKTRVVTFQSLVGMAYYHGMDILFSTMHSIQAHVLSQRTREKSSKTVTMNLLGQTPPSKQQGTISIRNINFRSQLSPVKHRQKPFMSSSPKHSF